MDREVVLVELVHDDDVLVVVVAPPGADWLHVCLGPVEASERGLASSRWPSQNDDSGALIPENEILLADVFADLRSIAHPDTFV